ncbi:MAG TPA: hypothetical protein VGH99_02835 [Pseudonocardia sp.]
MRSIPVDVSRVIFVGTGKTALKMEYVELSDGQRRASGNQAKHPDSGLPLWTVDVLIDDDDARRAEVIGVTVASADEPVTEKWRPVRFRGLTATIYNDQSNGRATVSLKADGVEQASSAARPTPVPAVS